MRFGPHISPEGRYAREIGITTRTLKKLGGADKLRSLAPEVRNVLIHPWVSGRSHEIPRGGQRARGFIPGQRGIETRKEQVAEIHG
jgi:hypothetical protein